MEISPKSVTKQCHQKILEQMNDIHKYIFRINNKVIGIFSFIQYKKNKINIIIINDYISDKKYLNTIKELLNKKEIYIDEIIYKNEINNITIIKIMNNKNKNIKYIELDDKLYEKESEIYYLNESIYIIQNNKNEISVSYGIIKEINKNVIVYSGNIQSNFSLIFNLNTNKLIGIHKSNSYYYNRGIIFKSISKEVKNYANYETEINILVNVQENDKDKEINFLNVYNNDIKKLDELNSALYINDRREENKTYIISNKIGINKIILKFNVELNNVENMFQNCEKIININYKNFNANNIKSMKCMFYNCQNLIKIDSLNIDTQYVEDMSNMFNGCRALQNFPDISKWNTYNVKDLSNMFSDCSSLQNLPDISKWDTHNVKDMSNMFGGCKSLQNLPDISKWDTHNVNDMSNLFNYCNSLQNLPDISKWDIHNVKDLCNMFSSCSSLQNLPDISKWDTHKVKDMSNMFRGCSSLKYLPDISKFDTHNVENISNIFKDCCLIQYYPDISEWDTHNIKDMSDIFYNCRSLKNLPDISKWDTSNVIDASGMFFGCRALKSLPNISKWNLDNIEDMRNIFEGCNSLTNLDDFAYMENTNVENRGFILTKKNFK